MPASKEYKVFNCIRCQNDFVQFNSRNVFCSKSCRIEYRKPEKRIRCNKYSIKNRDNKRRYDKLYYLNNSEKIKERSKKWREENKSTRWEKEKKILKKNPNKYLYKRIQTLLGTYLRKRKVPKYSKTFKILSFSLLDLEDKLKSTIPEGCTWEDFLKGDLHIDHIKPHSLFNYKSTDDDEFKECWS